MKILRDLLWFVVRNTGPLLSDRTFLKLFYYSKTGHYPDLDNPLTFNEKMQWLKLNDHKEYYHQMVDKSLAKGYIESIIGPGYSLKTYGVWRNTSDIDWDSLPDQFVMKLTADGGGRSVCICRDKSTFDRKAAVKSLSRDFKRDIYKKYREWAYKGGEHRIIAEELLEPEDGCGSPRDYKVWCFNGVPRFVLVCRRDEHTTDMMSTDWTPMPFWRKYPPSETPSPRPKNLEEMLSIAEKLSAGIPFLRVDMYNEWGKVYVGELTFYPGSGTKQFHPEEWNRTIGDWLVLPMENNV